MKRFVMMTCVFLFAAAVSFAQSAPADVLGEWDITTVSPLGETTSTLVLQKDGDTLKAVAKSPRGERPYDSVKLDGEKITLVLTVDYEGSPMVITYDGAIREKTINGSADFGGLAQGSFSATRKEPAK